MIQWLEDANIEYCNTNYQGVHLKDQGAVMVKLITEPEELMLFNKGHPLDF